MMRMIAVACTLLALAFFVGEVSAADKGNKGNKAGKNQMVRGTIKSVNFKDSVLIVSQKLKNETVDRQFDIKPETEFIITIGGETQELSGKEGLALLDGKEGAQVAVKCDKDVNVLKVTVKVKK